MLFNGLLFLFIPQLCQALLEETFISFTRKDGAVPIHDTAIFHSADDPTGVRIAIQSLQNDFEEITGKRPLNFTIDFQNRTRSNYTLSTSLRNNTTRNVIIAATVDSPLIQQLSKGRNISISDIQGKWETFKTAVIRNPFQGVDAALVIVGSDKRGTIFGIHTLAEQCGQSPFHYWLDTPTKKHSEIYALPKTTIHGEPSVKYRGLFINDEAPALTGWWSKHHKNDYGVAKLDSDFYKHVFDLLLRLKANYIWPAMWASFVPKPGNIFFTDDPYNQQLAEDYGIVVSTSHHEPMQRATNEWNAAETGPWDWEANKANVTRFMEHGVQRAGTNESYFTLGMRGPNDGAISADDPIAVLRDVFVTEREILAKYYGNVSAANQVWTIYKEVATYYAAGLIPPEDVTLMFTDDNWGNIMRFPTGNEIERSGGFGVYFHLEYVGSPKSYKWQNNNNVAKVLKDFYHAYERGANRIWVINVGDIKPMELPFSFIMDLAWNTSSINFKTIPDYYTAFAAREFGAEYAEEIGAILLEQNYLIGLRKFESVIPSTFSVLNYHEHERVLAAWKSLADRVTAVGSGLPQDLQAPYFHLVKYPIHSGYLYYSVVLGQAVNRQFGIEHRNAANAVAQNVLNDFDADFDLLEEYDSLVHGKWAGILSQPKHDIYASSNWKAPSRDVISNLSYVQLRQNLDYEFGNLGVYAEGSSSAAAAARICASIDTSGPTDKSWAPVLPLMDPYGPSRTVDLFHRGDFRVPIQRVNISIDWASVPSGFSSTVKARLNFDQLPWIDDIQIPVRKYSVPANFHGFPETSGTISIEAPGFQRSSEGDIGFEHIPYLGTRSQSGSIALRPYKEARSSTSSATSAYVEYGIYLYGAASSVDATVYINGALDTDPNLLMTFSLTLDSAAANFTRVVSSPAKPGDLPSEWTAYVQDHVWTKTVTLGAVASGAHTLRWSVNSPEVYLEKIVLNTKRTNGGVKTSYLGPPPTTKL
ncbi:hypothetical protein B0O99DRAFT_725600 [Bisporella sp. PMI_857]|nr:hypothetical protein B0O99DRAFT_725600 [Bisporella sp. PMI_857]